ncbi:L-lysine exporter family protein LysE/ArgO [Pasteurella langaaensis DSM 22999]|uniref:L-lysine exporter family protein LysE/ArgO n=1 Tax=Alitibacter langaaensis DSM 22999 TaxID=1122935 RepID=A0A2U0T814_9PAST|nr:LysE/ArgO family amino acid transporter [Pasteurella langaaensis]PVX39674.1 L-lysine exporter family protein LysE/ArgO [Pasteurella langaaensis DSM 22999]
MDFFLQGFLVCGGLIIAIGAQNAFVLKQGLLKQNILPVILTCFICDVILISMGVLGLGSMISKSQMATVALAIVGALFLLVYGARAFRSAYQGNSALALSNKAMPKQSAWKAVLATLAITLLNPHVYLDCFAIIGGIAGTIPADRKIFFLAGALCTSALWFFSLGYGARLLIPLFKRPMTWRVLDFMIGFVMWGIAFSLAQYAWQSY